jgi:hypothetical protein
MIVWVPLDVTTPITGTLTAKVGGTFTLTGSLAMSVGDTPPQLARWGGSMLLSDDISQGIASTGNIARPASFSYSLWIKIGVEANRRHVLVSQPGYWLQHLDAVYNAPDPPILDDGVSTSPGVHLVESNWHHIGWTVDGGSMTVRAYRDGVLVGTSVRTTIAAPEAAPFIIGIRSGAPWPYSGNMLDVRMYSGVLSDAEIAALYAGA